MFNKEGRLGLPLAVIELFARIGSIASVTLLVMLFLGDGFQPSRITANEWAGLLFFPLGVVIGMVVAWWKEGVGSVVTLGSLLGLYIVWGYLMRNHVGGYWFFVFASPGLLFLLHWFMHRVQQRYAVT
jgi:hypothetical protein